MLRIKNESVQSLTPLPAKRRETEAFGEEKGDILNFGGEEKCTGSLLASSDLNGRPVFGYMPTGLCRRLMRVT